MKDIISIRIPSICICFTLVTVANSALNLLHSGGTDMYAIVKAGGHQEKVEVGDVILVNRLDAKKGDTVEFPVALVVDGDKVTVNAKDLANISVKAEVVNDEAKGPKISIMKYKNKTGVARRKGHRQQLTLVKITAIA